MFREEVIEMRDAIEVVKDIIIIATGFLIIVKLIFEIVDNVMNKK
jgi:hypothetical protein